ncbi:MAG TPA: lysine--tRNA ligase [Alphaproteobacteria bacterium]|nr:lysine--tRNA ligase [Alphaproteobacteria bacterium]USO05855.1 MAG: lysine--tRNA ligase [Rhodospirillales bacterium]HOO82025.1 lysine--tRNA ligase [Alphaproteobacteria bacterium]
MTDIDKEIAPEIAQACRAWPFEEARQIIKRLRAMNRGEIKPGPKGYVLFETGYGPSGLPHIGTFGEVARTTMVLRAFKRLAPEIPVKLTCFSDDMDGLRKVPTNVPNPELLTKALGMPLSSVPNPFESDHLSFAEHNNDRLKEFLDSFGFEYEFLSSTADCYTNGRFNDALRIMLEKYNEVREAVLPILGAERTETYSPLFPIVQKKSADDHHPIILHNALLREVIDADKGIATFEVLDDSEKERSGYSAGETITQSIFDGGCKAQWRADWALRWYALDVDYEMAGKDLVTAADIAAKIVQILGAEKNMMGPAGFRYELFLDEKGQKISKSKGNGLSMEDWLTYAPHESLAYYMYQRPTTAKKLYFDIIPKAVDEYIQFVEKLPEQDAAKKLENPAWYIHDGAIPNAQHTPISFALLLNLVNAANTDDPATLWKFIQTAAPDATPESAPFLDRLVDYAIRYYTDFILPEKQYRAPDARETAALGALATTLENMDSGLPAEEYMTEVFSAGKNNGYEKDELRDWFKAIYEVCLGQSQGPRFGSFIKLYGVEDTVNLIRNALSGEFTKAA